ATNRPGKSVEYALPINADTLHGSQFESEIKPDGNPKGSSWSCPTLACLVFMETGQSKNAFEPWREAAIFDSVGTRHALGAGAARNPRPSRQAKPLPCPIRDTWLTLQIRTGV
ncbi:MAG: hypothetical protein WCS20_12420, partial [Alphaproteobacteria bacterium]